MQGNLLKGIDNCFGTAGSVVRTRDIHIECSKQLAEPANLGSAKTALKFKSVISIG